MKSSLRVATHLTGRPSLQRQVGRRARPRGTAAPLLPKPPPTSGAIRWILLLGIAQRARPDRRARDAAPGWRARRSACRRTDRASPARRAAPAPSRPAAGWRCAGDNMVGLGERLVDVAAAAASACSRRCCRALRARAARRAPARLRRRTRGQRFVLDFDRVGRVLGLRPRPRDRRGHRHADACTVPRASTGCGGMFMPGMIGGAVRSSASLRSSPVSTASTPGTAARRSCR